MKRLRVLLAGALLAGASFVTGVAVSQDQDMPEDVQAWLKYAGPNEHHAHLQKLVGTWDVTGTFWMQPGQPPAISKGTSTVSSLHGGRFITQRYEAEFMSEPFTGFGIDGYDRMKEKYVSVWTDSMGTGIYAMEGTREGDTTTMLGDWPDPQSGGKTSHRVKSVTTLNADGTMTYTMFDEVDGGWHKTMELVYTRHGK